MAEEVKMILPLREMAEQLRGFLVELHSKRDERREVVEGPDWATYESEMLEWEVYEIEQMASMVNILRSMAGKDLLPVADIYAVDRQAAGHVDYARKFAFYCAELVHDVKRKIW